MTAAPAPIRARRPRLRWYWQVLRLRLARLLLLSTRERVSRGCALIAALAALGALVAYPGAGSPASVVGGLEVRQAYIQWIVQIVVMIAAALISYAMRPKQKDPEIAKANVPVVEDGKGIVRIYGSVWIDDSIVLGFKQTGTTPIKAKGGKK